MMWLFFQVRNIYQAASLPSLPGTHACKGGCEVSKVSNPSDSNSWRWGFFHFVDWEKWQKLKSWNKQKQLDMLNMYKHLQYMIYIYISMWYIVYIIICMYGIHIVICIYIYLKYPKVCQCTGLITYLIWLWRLLIHNTNSNWSLIFPTAGLERHTWSLSNIMHESTRSAWNADIHSRVMVHLDCV